MKEGLEMVKPIDRQTPPALNLEREVQVAKPSQEKESLQDGRLANIVGAKQEVEPAQAVEVEVRQSPEPSDLHTIQMLVIRHPFSEARPGETRTRSNLPIAGTSAPAADAASVP